jgi:hypothetical protein
LAALFDLNPPPVEPPAVAPEEPAQAARFEPEVGTSTGHWVVGLGVALALGTLLFLWPDREPHARSSTNDGLPARARAGHELDDTDAALLSVGDGSLSRLEGATAALVDYARAEGRLDAVRPARKLLEAARSHDCDAVWVAIRELIGVEDITHPGHDAKLIELLLDLIDEGKAVCRQKGTEP